MITIGILEVGQNMPDLIPVHGTFADWFIPFLNKAERLLEYRVYEVYRGEVPAQITECDAWLVTGSEVSVYDDVHWLKDLGDFVLKAAETTPVIGICFGHQLLHHLYGGVVEKSDKGWGIGVQDYTIREPQSWMGQPGGTLGLLVSHQDQVMKPAPNSRTIAGSDFCPVGLSVIGQNVMSMQPHPELKPGLADVVFRMRRDEQGAGTTDAAIASMDKQIDDNMVAHWIIGFIEERLATCL